MRHRYVFALIAGLAGPAALVAQSNAKPVSGIHYVLAPAGNEVRFIVREQLAGATLPNDAIGSTRAISGSIVLDKTGRVDRTASRIIVALDSLTSDKDRRDRYIKRRTLVTDSFPAAEFVPTELKGLPAKLPPSGPLAFTILGDLTVHGVTRPVSWDATATVTGGAIAGRATTHLKFGDFGMERPRVMVVLSVEDDIKLEFDFRFVPAGS